MRINLEIKLRGISLDRAALKTMSESLWNKKVVARQQQTGAGAPKYLETIIPDAYQIDISIKSLVPESKNLLFHSALGSNTLGSGIYSASIRSPGWKVEDPTNEDPDNNRLVKKKDGTLGANRKPGEGTRPAENPITLPNFQGP